MLVLNRKVDQEILINVPGHDTIKIKVTHITPNSVKIGIDADKDIEIIRSEIEKLHRGQKTGP